MSQFFRHASRGAFPEGYYENPGSEAALRRSRAYGESIAYTLIKITAYEEPETEPTKPAAPARRVPDFGDLIAQFQHSTFYV